MTEGAVAVAGGTALLERAVAYTLGSLRLVEPDDMGRPTPCRAWDLRALLAHLGDSLTAIQEAAELGDVVLAGSPDVWNPRIDLVAALRSRACGLIGAWASSAVPEVVRVGGCPVPAELVTGAGALEVAVHGWDVSVACGRRRALPVRLAEELLERCQLFVQPADRPERFAAAAQISPWSAAGDRLLAYLGRTA
jgi:uncharacterized protein (TIGR03086 family)